MKYRWVRPAIWILGAITLMLAYSNCGLGDSEGGIVIVGNGMTSQNSAQKVAQALCQVVSTCAPISSPVSTTSCYTNIQPVANIVSLLGASSTTYPTFGSLITADLNGSIAGNTVIASNSVNQILGQSCSSAAVQGIFGGSGPNYSNVAAIVPTASTAIFAPPTLIYRSVGFGNTSALATGGANSLTISGSTATFASSLPNNVGVGDALQYQVGATWYLAFINGRISSTVFSLQTASGDTPTLTTSNMGWSIFRAYTSLQNALAASENSGINAAVRNFETWSGTANLMLLNQQWNVTLYADAPDTTPINSFSGWTTSAVDYVRIYVPYLSTDVGVSQRHSGVWNNSAYNLNVTTYYKALGLSNTYVWLDGLQIALSSTASNNYALETTASSSSATGWIKVSNCIIQNSSAQTTGDIDAIDAEYNTSASIDFYFWNIMYTSATTTQIVRAGSGTYYIYNNTLDGLGVGFIWPDNASAPKGVFLFKNNLVQGTTKGFEMFGASTTGSDYNLTGDTSSTGGAHDKTSQVVTFVNAGAENFLLSTTDTSAKGAGEDLSSDPSLSFDIDILGITRTDPWDIGASTPQ